MRTKIKEILTIMFSAAIMLAITACKAEDSTSQSESDPIAHEAAAITTTLSFSTTTTTTTTTTTARRTTTTPKATTTTTATTTTVVTTTTATTVPIQTAAAVTTAVPIVTTTAPAPIVVTTTAAPKTSANAVVNGTIAKTVMYEGKEITIYRQAEEPMDAVLQAYSDLAQYGVLTDDIRRIITNDIMSYAISRYSYVQNVSLYANSMSDYNCGFPGGARNDVYRNWSDEEYAALQAWGAISPGLIIDNNKTCAEKFRADCLSWVDFDFESALSLGATTTVGLKRNIGFVWLEDTFITGAVQGADVREDYKVYQISILY